MKIDSGKFAEHVTPRVSEDLGKEPVQGHTVKRANPDLPDEPLAVDEYGGGNASHSVLIHGDLALGIQADREGEAQPLRHLPHRFRGVANRDTEHGQAPILIPGRGIVDVVRLQPEGSPPTGEEVDQHGSPAVVGQREGASAETLQGEIWGRFPDLRAARGRGRRGDGEGRRADLDAVLGESLTGMERDRRPEEEEQTADR